MSKTKICCDQALFTSIRTPMGEGYRIIAASRGLRPDEKQAITRSSPSHDSLCWPATESAHEGRERFAVAFYPFHSGRMCVALSCYAGAEHTGRGGQRVYTHNVVFDKKGFEACGFNPFAVFRAMVAAGLHDPQLKPAPVLSELELAVEEVCQGFSDLKEQHATGEVGMCSAGDSGYVLLPSDFLSTAWRGHILGALLAEQSLIINVADGWLDVAEALLLGLPGPMRTSISFSAGLKFSVGRCHRLLVLHDGQGVTKTRIVGRNLELVNPTSDEAPAATESEWLAFVERHWSSGDFGSLSRRTSRPFSDVSHAGRERIARLYGQVDMIADMELDALLHVAAENLDSPDGGVESKIAADLIVAAQQSILDKLQSASWSEVRVHWGVLCALPRQSREGRLFVWPLLEQALRAALRQQPLVAAEAALDVAPFLSDMNRSDSTEGAPGLAVVVDEILSRTAEWAQHASDTALDLVSDRLPNLRNVASRWQAIRPECPNVQRIMQRCARATATTPSQ